MTTKEKLEQLGWQYINNFYKDFDGYRFTIYPDGLGLETYHEEVYPIGFDTTELQLILDYIKEQENE